MRIVVKDKKETTYQLNFTRQSPQKETAYENDSET